MKNLTLNLNSLRSAALAATLILGNGAALAQTEPGEGSPEPPAWDISKGINIKFVFGGNSYASLRASTSYDAASGQPYLLNWFKMCHGEHWTPNGSGGFTYKERMREVLDLSDFEQIKNDGFSAVRIFIDPMVLAAHPTTGVLQQTNPQYDYGMGAFVETINEAHAAGLTVILLCSAGCITQEELNTRYDAEQPRDENGNPRYEPIAYPGPTGKTLYWRPGTYTPTNSDPLRGFWQSLAARLKDAADSTIFPVPGCNFLLSPDAFANLTYEIYSESHNPDLTITTLNYPSGTNPTVFNQELSQSRFNWRAVQLNAMKGILEVNNQAHIIANTYDSFPESYVLQDNLQIPPMDRFLNLLSGQLNTFFAAYTPTELSNEGDITYSAHFYAPFRYSHGKLMAERFGHTEPNYRESRDQKGLANSYDPENKGIPEFIGQYGPLTGTVNRAFSWLSTWRLENGSPNMIISEFGAEDRCRPRILFPEGTSSQHLPSCADDSGFKACYLYDVRHTAEQHGMFWNVYEHIGGFGVYAGQLEKSPSSKYTYNQRYQVPKTFTPAFESALFQSGRPTEPD